MKHAAPLRSALCVPVVVSLALALSQAGCLSYLAATDKVEAADTVGYFTVDVGLGAATGAALWSQCETSRAAPCLPGTGNANASEWAASMAWGLGTAMAVDGLIAIFFLYADEGRTYEPE